MEAYVQALLPERERYLHQHALNKTRAITRSMIPAEKEAYLQSEAFQTTLRQLQRRDKIWQGLLRGELVLSGDRAEFERLQKLIVQEMQDGRKVDLAFLRTVEKSKVTLEKAYEALRIIRETPGLCGYDIAGRMKWKIRAKNWQEFPPTQKWFAVGECFSHLNYLLKRGEIRRECESGLCRYYVK